jgi:hypothetical protein
MALRVSVLQGTMATSARLKEMNVPLVHAGMQCAVM